jgi:non-specific serine/threonine protein kinase
LARRERLRQFERITPRPLPESGLTAPLYPYQKAGYDWLHFLHDYGFGGCLADEMGLGKTWQALALLLSLRRGADGARTLEAPDLVVVPRSLLFNWQREASRLTPDLRVRIHADNRRARDIAGLTEDADLILTTYGVLLRDIETLRTTCFHYAILDESQAIKNPLSQTARAARLLRAEHRLVLTGTPVENGAVELWSQFAFLNPGMLGGLERFREEFASAIERHQDVAAAGALRKITSPFLLRRTKDQVAKDLPPRTEHLVTTQMEPAQRKLYDQLRDRYRAQVLGLLDESGPTAGGAQMKILEGLLRLRQVCCHPRLVEADYTGGSAKFDVILESLETLRAEGHKALIFSQFTSALALLRDELERREIPYLYLDGRTRDRQTPVDRFQSDSSIPFFLISLKAGGVGLNLTAADYVMHLDPWWNPAVERQASDRAHRIGQDKPVFVYKYVMQDSVEEKILTLQERKRTLVDQLISAEGGLFKSLTRDDIAGLFT